MMHHSLLDDPLFRVGRGAGDAVGALALPQVLHQLADAGAPSLTSFEALQAHQQQPWHSFLVQLAAMAVARETGGAIPNSSDA